MRHEEIEERDEVAEDVNQEIEDNDVAIEKRDEQEKDGKVEEREHHAINKSYSRRT